MTVWNSPVTYPVSFRVTKLFKKLCVVVLLHSGENEYPTTYDSIVFVFEKLFIHLTVRSCVVLSSSNFIVGRDQMNIKLLFSSRSMVLHGLVHYIYIYISSSRIIYLLDYSETEGVCSFTPSLLLCFAFDVNWHAMITMDMEGGERWNKNNATRQPLW